MHNRDPISMELFCKGGDWSPREGFKAPGGGRLFQPLLGGRRRMRDGTPPGDGRGDRTPGEAASFKIKRDLAPNLTDKMSRKDKTIGNPQIEEIYLTFLGIWKGLGRLELTASISSYRTALEAFHWRQGGGGGQRLESTIAVWEGETPFPMRAGTRSTRPCVILPALIPR